MDANPIRTFDVPPVDPDHLRSALIMLYEWAEDGADGDGETIDPGAMNGEDLHGLLDRILRTCEVSREIAVALFQRAVALSAFCLETDLPETLFEEGLPGTALCSAAAMVPVLNLLSDDDNEMSHSFDERAMYEALAAVQN